MELLGCNEKNLDESDKIVHALYMDLEPRRLNLGIIELVSLVFPNKAFFLWAAGVQVSQS